MACDKQNAIFFLFQLENKIQGFAVTENVLFLFSLLKD